MIEPYYADELVTLYHGKAEEVLLELEPGNAAALITSPPYNVGLDYGQHVDEMPWGEYVKLARGVCEGAARALIDGGRAWVNEAYCEIAARRLGKGVLW